MDFFEVIERRKSVRHFTDDPVKEEDLMTMLEAARRAPSPENEQPWHFLVVRDRQVIDNLKDMVNALLDAHIQEAETKARKRALKNRRFGAVNVFDAPVVIVALSRPYPNRDPGKQPIYNQGLQGISAAIENLHLAATALGYGGCWVVLPLELGRVEIEAMLGVKKPWFALAMLSIGVPAKPPSRIKRKPLEEIVTFI
ncbi:MAG: nitroreductase family protein [Dehalococcoidia bacterium]